MIPIYNTRTFTQVWDSYSDFKEDFDNSPFANSITSQNAEKLYYLLYSQYGNNPIANFDVEQFKMKVFSIIFKYGPSWQKRLEIQDNLRSLTDEEIMSGDRVINNHAYNPSSAPSTSTREELDTINEQTSSIQKRSKINAYAVLWDLIIVDVTGEFIDRFKVCFKIVVSPERVPIYITEEDE